jgi:excisionase family DNA binding protein
MHSRSTGREAAAKVPGFRPLNVVAMTTSPAPSVYDIDLVGPRAVTEILDIEASTLVRIVNEGRLPAYRIGNSIRFRAIEVAAFRAALAV